MFWCVIGGQCFDNAVFTINARRRASSYGDLCHFHANQPAADNHQVADRQKLFHWYENQHLQGRQLALFMHGFDQLTPMTKCDTFAQLWMV